MCVIGIQLQPLIKTIVYSLAPTRFGDFDKLGGGFETPRIGHSKKTTQRIELLNRKFTLSWCYSICTAGVKQPILLWALSTDTKEENRLKH